MDNIYADAGIPVTQRYVRRSEIEREIRNTLLNRSSFNSLGITGLHKVGKTTLVKNMFIDTDAFIEQGTLPLYINMSLFQSADEFFLSLVKRVYEEFDDNCIELHDLVHKKYRRYLESGDQNDIFGFFRILKKRVPYRVVIVIDEFDRAITLFRYESVYFQILRSLLSEPDHQVGFLFISRRRIHYIEEQSPNNSTFANSFDHIYVAPYREQELEAYYQYLQSYFHITNDLKKKYREITGNYPYFMDMLSKTLVDQYSKKDISSSDIDKVYEKNRLRFNEQYQELKKILIEEGLFEVLLRMVSKNEPEDSSKLQVLKNYGVILENNQLFCTSFENYLLKDIDSAKIDITDKEQLELFIKVSEIEMLIANINDTEKNISKKVIFKLTDSSSYQMQGLRTLCLDLVHFNNFAGALYMTLYERTAAMIEGRSKNLKLLPNSFRHKHKFVLLVGSLRHHFGGHDTRSKNFKTIGQQYTREEILLELKGNVAEPDSKQEFLKMQLYMVEYFKRYLEELREAQLLKK